MLRHVFTALLVLSGSVLAADNAHAQFIQFGPNGSVGIRNGLGTYTYIYPDRLNPWANLAVPGSMQQLPNGQVWQGWDGKTHGNLVDPSTGNMHAFNHQSPNSGNQSNGFLVEPGGNLNQQRRQTTWNRQGPIYRQGPSQPRYQFRRR